MTSKTLRAPIHISVDKDLKDDANKLFNDLGMGMSTAITLFLKQSVRDQAIPFKIKKNEPNAQTIKAIEDIEKGHYEGPFDNMKDLMKALND